MPAGSLGMQRTRAYAVSVEAAALEEPDEVGLVGVFFPCDLSGSHQPDQRVDAKAVIRDAEAAGLRLIAEETVPPFEFLLVFGPTNRGS